MAKKKQVGARYDSNRVRLKTGESQRPNGTYTYRWSTLDGKRHSIYAPTLEELREQEEQIVVDKHDGIRADVKNIWIDCAQLENGAAMSAYNLVQNGGFEDTSSTVWEAINCTTDDKSYTGGTYGRHFYMKGKGSKDKRLIQKIYINRSASEVFLSISLRNQIISVPGISLLILITHLVD